MECKISIEVMNVRSLTQVHNGAIYKDKWVAFARDFKKIYDYKISKKKT
jgi:hypothetical protein